MEHVSNSEGLSNANNDHIICSSASLFTRKLPPLHISTKYDSTVFLLPLLLSKGKIRVFTSTSTANHQPTKELLFVLLLLYIFVLRLLHTKSTLRISTLISHPGTICDNSSSISQCTCRYQIYYVWNWYKFYVREEICSTVGQ